MTPVSGLSAPWGISAVRCRLAHDDRTQWDAARQMTSAVRVTLFRTSPRRWLLRGCDAGDPPTSLPEPSAM